MSFYVGVAFRHQSEHCQRRWPWRQATMVDLTFDDEAADFAPGQGSMPMVHYTYKPTGYPDDGRVSTSQQAGRIQQRTRHRAHEFTLSAMDGTAANGSVAIVCL